MIRNLILAVLAVTASAMLPTLGLAQTETQTRGINLSWQFPVGRKLEVEMTQRVQGSQSVAGQKIANASSNTNFMTWEVESFDSSSGVATLKSKFDRMKMSMNSPQGKFEVDSASDKELEGVAKAYGQQLNAMVGKSFTQTMDARGEVLTVDFPTEFNQAAMSKDAMEKLIKDTSSAFPKGPIAVGHSWNQETTTPMPQGVGSVKRSYVYTYEGRETVEGKELDVIDIDMTMTFQAPEESKNTIDITAQSTEGKLYFDAVNGHTTSMKIEQSMTMDVMFAGQKLSQTIENATEGKFRLAK